MTSQLIEPRADLDLGSGCDFQFGSAKVNAMFAALNRRDIAAIEALFPADRLTIEIWFGDPSLDEHLAHSSSLGVFDGVRDSEELGQFLALLGDVHFTFAGPLTGGRYEDGSLHVSISPLFWHASGPPLQQHVDGGGKTAIDCNSGLFTRVLLSPLAG